MHTDGPWNNHGGLTLFPMPGFREVADELKPRIEERSRRSGNLWTPVDIAEPELGTHANGEPSCAVSKQHVGGHDVFVLTSGPGSREMLLDLELALMHVAGRHPQRMTLMSGYFPTGRSDQDEGDSFALPPYLCRLWQHLCLGKLERVVCVDPHSVQITQASHQGFVTPIYMMRRLLYALIEHAQGIGDKIVLAFPDQSAHKRFKKRYIPKELSAIGKVEAHFGRQFPVVYADADRVDSHDKSLGAIGGAAGLLDGAIVLQVDDESATSGTQIKAAQRLKDEGATYVFGGVTHGVLAGKATERFGADDCPIDTLFMTDTIPVHNRPAVQALVDAGRIQVISWLDDLAWAIYRLHWNKSVREMR